MKLTNHFVGTINVPDGKIDVTDPCYRKGTWCRQSYDITPGEYDCYAWTGEDDVFGKRVWATAILWYDDSTFDTYLSDDSLWEEIGEIGVDAGLAGFFNNKPDFTDDEWNDFCHWMWDKDIPHNEMKEYDLEYDGEIDAYVRSFNGHDGFWTGSGCGDGCYPVYAIKRDGKIIALKIEF